MLVNNTSILFDPYTEHRDIIWLSRHIWIQLHLLWSSYLEATGSYLQNCPDFERKMTDPGQWNTVRCLEMTRTTSQAVAPPAETPLLHLLIKNGKKKLFSKLQRMTNCLLYSYSTKEKEKIIKVSITEDQMLPLNQLFKRKKKKRFCGPILVQLSPKQLKRLWKLYQLFLIYRFLWGYKKSASPIVSRFQKIWATFMNVNTFKKCSTHFSILCREHVPRQRFKVSLPTFLRAEVSWNRAPIESAYSWASLTLTCRLSSRSFLLPTRHITTKCKVICKWQSDICMTYRSKYWIQG